MRIKSKLVLKLLFLLASIVIMPQRTLADEAEEMTKQVGFTYVINHPDNQIEGKGALNLKMAPGQQQTVTATITNTSDRDLTLELSLNGARTNGNGGLEYGPSEFKEDQSMAYDLPDLVKVPGEIVVAKNSSKEIPLAIQMPEVAFEGIVTGGLQMMEKEEKRAVATETGIINTVAYLFGVTLQNSEAELVPELALYQAYPEQANYRNAVFLDIGNRTAMKIEGLMVDVEVTKAGKEDVLYESKKNNMEMAPNSLMSYPVSLSGEKMVAGKYLANVFASAHGKEWQWEKEFTITKEQADQFNQQDVSIVQERGLNWKLVVSIVFVLLFVMVSVYGLIKKRQSKHQSKDKRKKERLKR